VRTIWETYIGWFKFASTTELYPDSADAALAELVAVAGADAALERSRAALTRGDAVLALRLAEAVAATGGVEAARPLMIEAHRHLLDHGGSESFWEHGWLEDRIRTLEAGSAADA
jgi:alkyl sulfatase BDS1-like metallo-beta-lactamase superfamily hydrolase